MIDVELSMHDTHVGYHARINTNSDVQSGHQNAQSSGVDHLEAEKRSYGDRKHSRDD